MTPEDIKELRMRLKLTQDAFAHLLGVTFGTVNRWESGERKPSPMAIRALKQVQENLNE